MADAAPRRAIFGTAEGRRAGRATAARTGTRTVGGAGSIRFFAGALEQLFESEEGPVGKELARRAIKVENSAKRLCPVDTGRLRSSITHSIERDSEGLVAFVGTDVNYALYVELGTRHTRAQPFLRPATRSAGSR